MIYLKGNFFHLLISTHCCSVYPAKKTTNINVTRTFHFKTVCMRQIIRRTLQKPCWFSSPYLRVFCGLKSFAF
jgi:hypothetical protein